MSDNVSQPLLREGPVYHPCTAPCLPLNAVYISKTAKKSLETHILQFV